MEAFRLADMPSTFKPAIFTYLQKALRAQWHETFRRAANWIEHELDQSRSLAELKF